MLCDVRLALKGDATHNHNNGTITARPTHDTKYPIFLTHLSDRLSDPLWPHYSEAREQEEVIHTMAEDQYACGPNLDDLLEEVIEPDSLIEYEISQELKG